MPSTGTEVVYVFIYIFMLLLFCNCAARLSLNVFGSSQNIQKGNMNVKYWWLCMHGSVKVASQKPIEGVRLVQI